MKTPLFIRPLSATEQQTLDEGSRSPSAFTRRRCRILLANSAGKTAPQIADSLGCAQQTVLNALNAFASEGLDCLTEKSHRPKSTRPLIAGHSAETMRAMLGRSPREFGKPHGHWTLAVVAEVAFERGLSDREVSDETIRQVVKRLGMDWKLVKHRDGAAANARKAPGRAIATA